MWSRRIIWEKSTDPFHPFIANFEGKRCVIRVNDLPAEHLYTLIVDGEEVFDFDDWSEHWSRS